MCPSFANRHKFSIHWQGLFWHKQEWATSSHWSTTWQPIHVCHHHLWSCPQNRRHKKCEFVWNIAHHLQWQSTPLSPGSCEWKKCKGCSSKGILPLWMSAPTNLHQTLVAIDLIMTVMVRIQNKTEGHCTTVRWLLLKSSPSKLAQTWCLCLMDERDCPKNGKGRHLVWCLFVWRFKCWWLHCGHKEILITSHVGVKTTI